MRDKRPEVANGGLSTPSLAPSRHPPEVTTPKVEPYPGPLEYVRIAVILAVITAVEVAVYYIDAFERILPPTLMALAVTKFSLVAMWYMHLKFDSRFFSALFVGGLLSAVTAFVVVLLTFRVFLV